MKMSLVPLPLIVFIAAMAATAQHQQRKNASLFPNGRIIGGENAVIENFPYQISLENLGHHSCGGSIISEYYAITAAHCVATFPASSLTVRAGSSLKGQGGSVHHVEKVVVYEKYTINEYGVPVNDVAILKLKEPFNFDDTRRPIKLFEPNEESAAGVSAVVTGWGITDKGQTVQLQTVELPILAKKLCDEAYKCCCGGLAAGQICAAYYGLGGKDACQGDSGGPLSVDGRLAGIVSWGNGCAEKYYPGVYTEVAHFRGWINEHAILKTSSH